jgi:hypothetical protein
VEEVQRDLDGGYVTAAAAGAEYGCVVRDGVVDADATAARRARARGEARPA